MLTTPSKIISIALVLLSSFFSGLARGEDLAAAVAAGKVSVTFHGTGGSTGDAIEVVVTKTRKGGESLELTVPAGTRLTSGNAGSQSMVIASVKGQVFGGNRYIPSATIEATSTPKTYVMDAYCAEFEKDNPSSATRFSLGRVDPVLACILSKASDLSQQARQAAVWIYTDKVNFAQMNRKFSVSQSDWNAAKSTVQKCLAKKGG